MSPRRLGSCWILQPNSHVVCNSLRSRKTTYLPTAATQPYVRRQPSMVRNIEVARVSGSTLFKMLFVGSLAFHVLITLLIILLTLAGILPLETSAEYVPSTSLIGFLVGYLMLGILLSPFWVGALWLSIWPGLWLYSNFKTMKIHYIEQPNGTHS